MTTRPPNSRDFLALAVPVSLGNRELERIRSHGAECVMAIHRLAGLSLLHAGDTEGLARTADQSHTILRDFAAVAKQPIAMTFLGDTIYVCGYLLRASRDVYECAIELGSLMTRCGVFEVTFDPALTRKDLLDFISALSTAVRDPERRTALVQANIGNVIVRPIDPLREGRESASEISPHERVLHFYASALVIMRQLYRSVAEESAASFPVQRVKRIAQQLVTLAERDEAALLGMTAMATAHRDDAGRAVQSALLAVALGRQITTDRGSLSQLAMASLLIDVGRVRFAGAGGRDRKARLDVADETAIPPTTAAVSIALGGVSAHAALRTAIVYETTTLEREPLVGPLYQRQVPALVQSRILHLVRMLLDRLAPRDASVAMGPLDALEDLARMSKSSAEDAALLRALVGLLGVVPIGSVVELDTGEWAVVLGPSSRPSAFAQPRIRKVTDTKGRVLDPMLEIDLGIAADSGRAPAIVRIVPPKDARMNVAHVFLA